MELTQIPPAHLVPHENNAHSELRGIDALAQTIEYLGIIEPLVVLPADEDGRHTIVAGHRRHAAATQVGLETVPCVVVDDPGAGDQLVTMLVENLHRDDLTVLEEAQAYQQLTLLDWQPERIARATGREVERVQQSLTLHQLPEHVQQAANAGEIDLVAAATMHEFVHDPKAIDRIMKKGAGYWGYQHAIADERTRQENQHALEVLKAELVLAGVKVTARPKFASEGGTAVLVEHLVDADGNPVRAEAVQSEPGFAVYINRDYQPKPVTYCPDPAAVGLRPAPDTWEARNADREALEAEAAARRAAWEAATVVRREFLLAQYGNAKGAKKLLRPALRDLAGTRMNMPLGEFSEFADALCGCPIRELPETAGMDRLTRAAVGRWLAHCEANLKDSAFGSWGDFEHALRYLDLIVADGYELADIEAQLHQSITDALTEDDTEPDGEDSEEEEEDDSEADPSADHGLADEENELIAA
ncbi:ParB/RepB/Spo0J family partition protein [Glycomyces harbinensis]|uniref:Chromosome partitioning protein, ParB family n=1 Tax=Glycomyces harbinensis TaxID=58114 RepID=A0A1G6YAT0_9ACTN|nr:ParB/RepB/Spo0J family partition protein [Glycomyces harbinensis]SDD87460.1 chromosome partitioning protein, ParB family [Glycomyces harbinensis]